MKTHAYLIMAHNEPESLKILLSLLDDIRNNIYIHIDERSNSLDEHIILDWCKQSNIKFIKREKAYWSGYKLVNITTNLLQAAIKDENVYYHFLSGVDLPLKTQDELHSFFNANPTQEYISTGKVATWKIASRYKYYYFEKWTEIFSRNTYRVLRLLLGVIQSILFIDRTRYSNIEYHMGGQWFSITHQFANYTIENMDFIKDKFDYGFCVDEVFLPTLVMNSPFRDNVSPMMNLRYVDWNRGKPYTWKINDFMELTKNNHFFARKFSYEKYPEIMEKIRNHVENISG
jgi:hypothetical protein